MKLPIYLDYSATNALALNAGTILDAATNAAVLTLQKPARDSVIQFSFKLDGASAFNLSYNHAKGHLFRIVVNNDGFTINKDKDKKDPTSKAVQLGKASGKFETGKWQLLIYSTLMIVLMLVLPNGILSLGESRRKR